MALITVTIPTVPYGNVKVEAETAREVNQVLADSEFEQVLVYAGTPYRPVGAPVSPDEVLPEGEALEKLKEALGATESPVEDNGQVTAPTFKKVSK